MNPRKLVAFLPFLAIAIAVAPAAQSFAIGVSDFFAISFSAQFSRSSVAVGETISVTVNGSATCVSDLLFPFNMAQEVQVAGRIVGVATDGTKVVLNPGYSVDFDPSPNSFPSKKGEIIQASQTLPLFFPPNAPSGTYVISGETLDDSNHNVGLNRVKVGFLGWQDITPFLPRSTALGSLDYGTVTSIPAPTEAPVPQPSRPAPPPTLTSSPKPAPSNRTSGTVTLSGLSSAGELLIDVKGVVQHSVQLSTPGGKVTLNIGGATIISDAHGGPLVEISALPVADPSAPMPRALVTACSLGPEGARFTPPITLTISYAGSGLPSGAGGKDLYIAYWDGSVGAWLALEGCVVDSEKHVVSASIQHFSTYAIFAPEMVAPLATAAAGPSPALTPAQVTVTPSPSSALSVETPPRSGKSSLLVGVVIMVLLVVLAMIVINTRRSKNGGVKHS